MIRYGTTVEALTAADDLTPLAISDLLSLILREDWPALHQAAPAPAAWQAVHAEARRHGLAPLLYTLLRRADYLAQLPQPVIAALHKESARTAVSNLVRLRALDNILAALQPQGITPVLLKGIGLLHSVYPQPNLRPMVDMDILVLPEEFRPALACLQTIGYQPAHLEQFPGAYESVTHHVGLRHPEGKQHYLELHHYWLPLPRHMMHASMRDLRRRARPIAVGQAGHTAYLLAVEDQILQMAAHIAGHAPSAVRWLWFYDLFRLIRHHREQIAWDVLLARAQAYQLVFPLQWVLPLITDRLQAPIPRPVLRRLSSLPVSRAEAGRFAPDRPAAQTRLVDGLHKMRYGSWRHRAHFAWSLLFPQRAYMQALYPADNALKLGLRYPLRWFSVLHEAWSALRKQKR